MHLEKIATVKATKTRPQVSLLSNRSQNDIIAALGTYIRKEIQREIKEAEMYSILLDETSDVSHKEQVSFVVRYFHHMQIKERFIEVCNVDTTTGQELENTVFLLLQKNGLEMKNMYGQGYDGAANMSGMYKGLQARIRAHNEKALYVHCKAHCLNLVLVEASKSSKHFVTFFNLVEKLYAFCSGSPKRHAALVKFQESLFPGQRVMELQQLSDTRWACREKALKALQRNLKAILMLLDDISDSDPPNLAQGDAQMYRNAINFMFILCMEITTPVFEVTALASDSLQEEGLDHSTAYKVLQLIQERGNICRQLHLPAQSGSSQVLQAMRRGYTREAYLELVANIRRIIPGVSLSSDFIAGFCGETEEDHQQTLSLLREVRYQTAFLFAYSMRKKTHAFHRLQDDVPVEVKQRRLEELISVFREEAVRINTSLIGSTQLILVEGESKRSSQDLCGRNEGNIKVIFPRDNVPLLGDDAHTAPISPGGYVLVKITSASSQSLRGHAMSHASLSCTGRYPLQG
ncbi:mitochondrial tRNA methylthiotransferase CDK5RAP1 isoform X3 [Paramormyrops kingsleyae]|uniref:mitochondrial tRNA methylthiotransferase CDK5RAP1 isoform X3 n=1 Tax=Paramormyrops kingsleyae TaxID=1676925 RepID=UPI003B96F242